MKGFVSVVPADESEWRDTRAGMTVAINDLTVANFRPRPADFGTLIPGGPGEGSYVRLALSGELCGPFTREEIIVPGVDIPGAER